MVSVPTLIVGSVVLTLLLQALVLLAVNRRELLAEVNERSSHERPTPTMGGVSVVMIVMAYLIYLSVSGVVPAWQWAIALGLIAIVGLWDDLQPLRALPRIAVHIFGAVLGIVALQLSEPLWLMLILVVAVVWFTNLFNFMDGIDGIAGVQVFVFCLGAQITAAGIGGWYGDLLWVVAGASVGFLAYNWPPARIFMGDVGSGFLGLLLALLVILLWQKEVLPLIASLILLAGFWFDATYTLCVRMLTGQPFTQAHRSHLYQRLARRKGHLWTTGVYCIFSAFWLMPLAWIAAQNEHLQLYLLVLSVLPLAFLCWRFQAGIAGLED